jgi:hypothetical protein
MSEVAMNVYFAHGFASDKRPYYGFNYYEKSAGKTNGVHIHQDHPIFRQADPPRDVGWNNQKFVVVAEPSPKTKTEYGITYYIYDPDVPIADFRRVGQCYICSHNPDKRNDYANCVCSCQKENFATSHTCD